MLDRNNDRTLGMLADGHAWFHREGQLLNPEDGTPNLGNAIRLAQAAAKVNPGRSSHFARLARLYLASWRRKGWPDVLQKAYEAMRTAVALFPSYPALHVEFAEVSERIGMPGQALEHFREAKHLDGVQYHHTRRKLTDSEREWVMRRIAELEKAHRAERDSGEGRR